MTPSAPTAHPVRLSAAKRTAWIAFPCGRGFCHAHARSACAAAPAPAAHTAAHARHRSHARARAVVRDLTLIGKHFGRPGSEDFSLYLPALLTGGADGVAGY